MRILVLIKVVPDTETRVRIAADGRSLDETEIKWIVSPYDEFALEEALRIVEKRGSGEVTVVTLGDERAQPVLRGCLAMGATRAVLLGGAELARGDAIATARCLAAACRRLGFDLILAGRQGVGEDRGVVGPMVAELLDLPHVSAIVTLEVGEGKARCERDSDAGREVVETSLPALFTAHKGLNEPRYASLKGIMAAKKKPLDTLGLSDLGLEAARVGSAGSAERWTALALPEARPAGRILKGPAGECVPELVRLLAEEAKVI